MNQAYLIKHISCQLHTFVRYYNSDLDQIHSFCGRPDFDDSVLFGEVFTYCRSLASELPQIFQVNSKLFYGWIPDSEGYYLLGPGRFSSPIFFVRQMQSGALDETWISEAPVCNFQDIISAVLLLYNLFHKEELDRNTLINYCCIPKGTDEEALITYSELVFQNQEYGQKHNPYAQETREQHSIELGDTDLLKKSIEEDFTGIFGTLSKDYIRNWKYLAVAVIALASRSAIRGGLPPEISYSLVDSYIQKIDLSSTQPHIYHLVRTAEFQFARMVREQKARQAGIEAKKNPYIEQCKDYIFSHLHDKLEVTDIAAHLSLNANYLSELFHKYEGVTLKMYIHQEKVNLAKNLLIYSRYTYSEIATYLGFSSQSHLGKIFKQITGYTLSQYRKELGSPEFL